MKTAILIDGGFFLHRIRHIHGLIDDPKIAVDMMCDMVQAHLHPKDEVVSELYRVFYYDAAPYTGKQQNPISGKQIDFGKTPQAKFRKDLFELLKHRRKFALRLGDLRPEDGWLIHSRHIKELLSGKRTVADLTGDDVYFSLRQKAVDIKIGLDIASLAYKRLVDQIILVSGDSDFVPAAKVARREGIDFVLDPMWNPIDPDLFEHIDGLRTVCPHPDRPKSPKDRTPTPIDLPRGT